MKKYISLFISLFVLLVAACSKAPEEQKASDGKDTSTPTKVVIASSGSDTDVWRYIAKLPATQAAGVKIEVKNFNDYVAMNNATANKEVDLNAFQSYNYLLAYNAESKAKIAPVSTTYIEPMGIYSDKVKSVDQLADKATIAIPNDAANESRALSLLQSAGLIKLKADFDPIKGTTRDVVENPKQLQLKPIPMATAVRVKSEIDAIVLGNTLAMEGGLNVTKDSIYYEKIDQSTKLYVNVLATAAGRENDATLKKVGELYHLPEVKKFIDEHFGGTKLDVNKPVAYLTENN